MSLERIKELHKQIAEKKRMLARTDANAFIEMVMKDERTNKPIKQAPMHKAWQMLADKYDRLIIWSHVEAGKSQNLAVGRTLFELGKDPSLRIAICSNTYKQAEKILTGISQNIMGNEALHGVFPNLKPSEKGGDSWSKNSITVMREGTAKDPSVQVVGVHGAILGSRLDLLILDDVLDYENCRTKSGRDDLIAWIRSTLFGRLTANARVLIIGNAYHPDDALHTFAKEPAWRAFRYPVIDDETGQSRWPEVWPAARIAKKKQELGTLEFARQMLCLARDDSESRFQSEWIEICKQKGEGRMLTQAIAVIPPGFRIITGVDLAVQQKDASDSTCFFTIAVHPNGDREVISIERGKWSGPIIVSKMFEIHHRYQSFFVVENNGSQDFLLQFARERGAIPMRPFTTGRQKAHPEFGIESIAAEMSQGKWIIPNISGQCHPEVQRWLDEMLWYDPAVHTGDALMACVTPGHRVWTTEGPIPIENIKNGDVVLTHKGNWKRVTGTESRQYNGEIVRLKPSGMLPVELTAEHMVWSAETKIDYKSRENRMFPGEWGWKEAENIRCGVMKKGDFVLCPVPSSWPGVKKRVIDLLPFIKDRKLEWGGRWHVETRELNWRNEKQIPRFMDIDQKLGLLIGLYLAEGYIRGKPHQVVFCLHQREKYLARFIADMADEVFNSTASMHLNKETKGMEVYINSAIASRWFSQFGKGAENVKIPWSWMNWQAPVLLAIVRGWLIGDGSMHYHKKKKAYNLKGVSISQNLIHQMQNILMMNGLNANVGTFKQSGFFQGKPCKQHPAWRICLTSNDTKKLLQFPHEIETKRWKIKPSKPRDRTNSRQLHVEEGVAIRLTSTETKNYQGPVYNLHVEDDESFVVEGIAVHNCYFAREGVRMQALKAETGRLDLTTR